MFKEEQLHAECGVRLKNFCFCPPVQRWFFRVGMSEAKKSTLEGEEHNFLSEYGYSTGVSQLHKPETQAQWDTHADLSITR